MNEEGKGKARATTMTNGGALGGRWEAPHPRNRGGTDSCCYRQKRRSDEAPLTLTGAPVPKKSRRSVGNESTEGRKDSRSSSCGGGCAPPSAGYSNGQQRTGRRVDREGGHGSSVKSCHKENCADQHSDGRGSTGNDRSGAEWPQGISVAHAGASGETSFAVCQSGAMKEEDLGAVASVVKLNPRLERDGGNAKGQTAPEAASAVTCMQTANGAGAVRVKTEHDAHATKKEDLRVAVSAGGPNPLLEPKGSNAEGLTALAAAGAVAASIKSENEAVSVKTTKGAPPAPAIKSFQGMNWEEKVHSQFRFDSVPHLSEEAHVEDGPSRVARKEESARKAVQAILKRMHSEAAVEIEMEKEEDVESSSDDGDVYGLGRSRRPEDRCPLSEAQVRKFFESVPSCLLMTIGFDVAGLVPGDENHCHCPCGKDMVKWRQQFGLEGSIAGEGTDSLCSKGRMEPLGLMGHLRTEGRKSGTNGLLHFGLQVYMEHLYGMHDGSYRSGSGHKAMYNVNGENWKRAEAAEKRERDRNMKAACRQLAEERARREELEEKQQKQEEKLSFLETVNKRHWERIQELERERKALHVEPKKDDMIVSSEMEEGFRTQVRAFFETVQAVLKSQRKGACDEMEDELVYEPQMKFNVKQESENFLQEFFDVEYGKAVVGRITKDTKDARILFSPLDLKYKDKKKGMYRNYHGMKIVLEWSVTFQNDVKYVGGSYQERKKRKEADTAIDQGGPSRAFLSRCWNQMGDLHLKLEDDAKVRLFERQDSGYVPVTDDMLLDKIGKKRNFMELLEQAKAYYRALGRIMLHSLALGYTISSSTMPPLYQNYLLRGCTPKDPDYQRDDILNHLKGIDPNLTLSTLVGAPFTIADDQDEIILDEKNIFTIFIPRQFLDSRRISLDAMQEGLTLDGDYKLSKIFRAMPLEAAQKVIFSHSLISAAAVIRILKPKYMIGWEGDKGEGQQIEALQRAFFKDTLQQTLVEREERDKKDSDKPSFLAMFVAFCTGYNYLPDPTANPDFAIPVEFNFAEMAIGDYPFSHSCGYTLKLPGYMYPNRNDFERKLELAVLSCHDRFDMN